MGFENDSNLDEVDAMVEADRDRRRLTTLSLKIQTALNGYRIPGSHFVYASGAHGPDYLSKDAAYEEHHLMRDIEEALALLVPPETGILTAPAVAGVFLVRGTTERIADRPGSCVPYMGWAEKDGHDGFKFRTPFRKRIEQGLGVTILEDVVTTSGSVSRVEDAIVAIGGRVLAVVCMWNRGVERATRRGTPIRAAVEVELPMYHAERGESCPLCDAGVPIDTRFGHGKDFLEARAKLGK